MERLRLRATDCYIHEATGIWPLSVSSNLIAIPAMRCAGLLSRYEERHGPVARDGSGKLIEVYPAAALKVWGQEPTRYKRKEGASRCTRLVDWLRTAAAPWLAATEGVWRLCRDSDDALDAVPGLAGRSGGGRGTVPDYSCRPDAQCAA